MLTPVADRVEFAQGSVFGCGFDGVRLTVPPLTTPVLGRTPG